MSQKVQEREELMFARPVSRPEQPSRGPLARLPFSPLGRIAFWSSLIGTIIGAAGAALLTFVKGSPSTASVTVAIFWLVTCLMTATRYRWAPLFTTLTSGYVLYSLVTEPYSIASLASPKDPQLGGLGHFIASILIIACALLAFGSSFGSAIENFSSGSNRRAAPRWLAPGLTLVAGFVIGSLLIGILSHPASATTGATTTNGVPTVHMNASNFEVSSITITKGSKLILADDSAVNHVLFNGSWQNGAPNVQEEPGAPTIHGLSTSGNSVTVGPFTTAGTYHILCTVHQGMNLTVIVQ